MFLAVVILGSISLALLIAVVVLLDERRWFRYWMGRMEEIADMNGDNLAKSLRAQDALAKALAERGDAISNLQVGAAQAVMDALDKAVKMVGEKDVFEGREKQV